MKYYLQFHDSEGRMIEFVNAGRWDSHLPIYFIYLFYCFKKWRILMDFFKRFFCVDKSFPFVKVCLLWVILTLKIWTTFRLIVPKSHKTKVTKMVFIYFYYFTELPYFYTILQNTWHKKNNIYNPWEMHYNKKMT